MANRNFQREMDNLIAKLQKENRVPTLLLHSCCAPCSSYVLEYLSDFFIINVLYYNPNISSKEEYDLRLAGEYKPEDFYSVAKGLEKCPERGKRCHRCYRLRLEHTAKTAKETGADYFATTLTLSPLKDAKALNEIGKELSAEYNVDYLCSDFKKKEGYKRSLELSRQYGLYRQNFCGCVYSRTSNTEEN